MNYIGLLRRRYVQKKTHFNPKTIKENKEHYKLYKVGKFLQTAMLSVLVAGSLVGPLIHVASANMVTADSSISQLSLDSAAPAADLEAWRAYDGGFASFGMKAGVSNQPTDVTVKKGNTFSLSTQFGRPTTAFVVDPSSSVSFQWYKWNDSTSSWAKASGSSSKKTSYNKSTSTYQETIGQAETDYYYCAVTYKAGLLSSSVTKATNVVAVNVL